MDEEYRLIKLILIGDTKTGKTKFNQYLVNGYESINFDSYKATIGGTLSSKQIIYKNNKFKFEIWDTTGQERYIPLIRVFIKKADMVFIFYDSSEKKTFERAKYFFDLAKDSNSNINCIYILIGNKYEISLDSKIKDNYIPEEEVFKFISENNMPLVHISIAEKYSNGINELLKKALDKYIQLKNIE